jgi:maltose O-acetyltransferase
MEATSYDRMRAGEIYVGPDWDLIAMQMEAGQRLAAFNAMTDLEARNKLLGELLGSFGRAFVTSPVRWEYGRHIHLGDGVFINFDCVFLDGADIRIGDGTLVGPRAQFLTAGHPVDPAERVRLDEHGQRIGGYCLNKPITVGRDCWIGAGAVILGGVSIGEGTTIGAGSVVTRDIAAGVLAAGNPCRVIRPVRPMANDRFAAAAEAA